jgi:hypothetical protein
VTDGEPPTFPAVRKGVATWEPEWRELWQERAAVYEFDGGLRRPLAEQRAWLDVGQQRAAAIAPTLEL